MSTDSRQEIAQIDHIALATEDVESLCDFYRRLGGVILTPSPDLPDGPRRCVLDFFGIRLELLKRLDEPENNRAPRLLHLGFALRSADAVDELTRVLAAGGHRVLEPPRRAGSLGHYESLLLDPDGNRVKLSV